jgi:ribonuclease P protein component
LAAPPSAPRRRLTRSADFDVVYRRGHSRSSRHLSAVVFARVPADAEAARLGVSVPRAVGTAAERNRVKRQLREAFAQLGGDAGRGADIALVARPGLGDALAGNGFAWLVAEVAGLVGQEASA